MVRVAYDISILAEHFVHLRPKSGLDRVIEELLLQLHQRTDLELVLAGMCGANPLAASVLSSFYVSSQKAEGRDYAFRRSFRSRLGLDRLYEVLYRTYAAEWFIALPKRSLRSLAIRAPLKALRHAAALDVTFEMDPGGVDVFHSPYLPLPPRSVTGSIPRVLTVYDLIPVLAPQFVIPSHTVSYQSILDSIDVNSDWIAAISEFSKQEFCHHTGMPEDRVRVTPLAAADHFRLVCDADAIAEVRSRYGIPEGRYLLSIANLEPRKNLPHLIQAFFRLLAGEPLEDVSLVLVGSKGMKHEEIFEAAASDASFGTRVIFTGHIPDADLSTIYSGAVAFVYPSLYEGFGLPPLEAMQCGVPVITSNTTSLPEVVGDAAITVDPSDGDALCDAILRILSDTQLRADLRRKGLARAQDFSWARCAGQTVELYRTAIGHP